jgi:hypothetical protein
MEFSSQPMQDAGTLLRLLTKWHNDLIDKEVGQLPTGIFIWNPFRT